jgi:hypothetical protein
MKGILEAWLYNMEIEKNITKEKRCCGSGLTIATSIYGLSCSQENKNLTLN